METLIAKTEPLSARHWPGLAYVVYFAGCDYNCPFCNVPEMLSANEEYVRDTRDIKTEIRQYANTIKAVVFTGGEPCLQRQPLIQLASFAKDLGLQTGVETNGSKTECIRSLLRLNIIDQIALDLKSSPVPEKFQKATKSRTFFKTTASLLDDLRNTISLLDKHKGKVNIEVRTTIVPTINSRKEDVTAIADMVELLGCSLVLQQYDPGTVMGRLADIKAPSTEFLKNLAESVQKKYGKLRVSYQSSGSSS